MKGIPYQFVHPKLMKKGSKLFFGIAKILNGFFPSLTLELSRADKEYRGEQYLSMCLFNNFFLFIIFWILFLLFSPLAGESEFSLAWPLTAIIIIIMFVFLSQLIYPSIIADKNRKSIETNLVAALKTIHVQLSSGVSLFDSLVTVSQNDYGEISNKFKDVIKKINTGTKQEIALEQMISVSSSKLFKRSIWQIINGMKTGADIEVILKETINSLTEEQIVQIQQYGSKLTPLTMFYMMLVVIIPTLSMIFLMLVGSLASISELGLKLIFFSVLVFVGFVQYMFIGIIKSKRPALLGDD